MAAEIERKFLLGEPPDWLQDCASVPIEQGYVALAEETEVRLRKAGERRLLTVKRGQGEVREEVEIPLGEDQFDALWPLTARRQLAKTRFLVALEEGLEAEVDVFEGDLKGLAVAEVEFESERQSGDFEAPRWLGEEITGDPRYANRELALRGLGMLGPPQDGNSKDMSSAVHSKSYRLKEKERADEGIRRLALGRAEQALEKLEGADGDRLATSIHGARKDLKKLRAALRLVREELGKKLFKAEDQRYRDAGRQLASSRDAEVKLETLAALAERFEGDLPRGDTRRWKEALERQRDRLADSSGGETQGRVEVAAEAIEAGRVGITQWPLRADSWELVRPGLSAGYRRGRRALKQTLEEPSAANVHEWRKRAKDLWYQLRILRDAWPELLGETADQAHELADLLGDHHDLAVLAEDLAGREEPLEREAFEASIQRRQGELLASALGLGRRLYAEKPKAFSRRIEAYWSAWRED